MPRTSAFRKAHAQCCFGVTALEKQRRRGPAHYSSGHAEGKVWHAALFWKLNNVGVNGKLWRIIHELYTASASTPIIEGQTTDLPILQGLPRMSPTLFNICIDDLLEELQTVCLQDGIAMNDAETAW
jgi:hypothetical protein